MSSLRIYSNKKKKKKEREMFGSSFQSFIKKSNRSSTEFVVGSGFGRFPLRFPGLYSA